MFKAIKAVYSYFFPEVRKLVHWGDTFTDRLYLTTTKVDDLRLSVSERFNPPLPLPSTPEGMIDLDQIHEPIIDRIVKAYKPLVPVLKGFKYRYPTSGSSEGIFHLLAEFKAKGWKNIWTLRGEYEGYKEYAKTLGMKVTEINNLEFAPTGSLCFISNPSAIYGNIISNDYINSVCESHNVVLDLAYVGMTRPNKFDISHKNINAVVMSLSKPYGVFRFRIGGFCFSRSPLPSLYANKWFKDIPRLLTTLNLVEEIPPGSLFYKYSRIQLDIIEKLQKIVPMLHSDVFLLGHIENLTYLAIFTKKQQDIVCNFKRGHWYRFCLTPYFEMIEKGEEF